MDPFLGEIRMVGFSFAPVGWLTCEGQTLQISQYNALFALLGTTFGGNGSSTFCLPDLRGRVPIDVGASPDFPSVNYVWGQKAGAPTAPLTAASLPAHTHPVAQPVSTANGTTNSPANACPAADVTTLTLSSGHGTAVTNSFASAPTSGQTAVAFQSGSAGSPTPTPVSVVQPVLAVYFIIAYQGIFPTRP